MTSKVYCFNDPIFRGAKIVGNVVKRYTEYDVLKEYWRPWLAAMEKKYGAGHELITKENCIKDWKAVNWAWEVEVEDESGTPTSPQEDAREG